MAAVEVAVASPESKQEVDVQQTTSEPQLSTADTVMAEHSRKSLDTLVAPAIHASSASSPDPENVTTDNMVSSNVDSSANLSYSMPKPELTTTGNTAISNAELSDNLSSSSTPNSRHATTSNTNTITITSNIDSSANLPSPSISPTLALPPDPCPSLNRSVSTASSDSLDGVSICSRQSDGASSARRRGYMRPQATLFAESAKNRESVMSLGTIAHLQYYFARTGLLDGKGGQLLRGDGKGGVKVVKRRGGVGIGGERVVRRAVSMGVVGSPSFGLGGNRETSCAVSDSGLVESPIEEGDADDDGDGDGSIVFEAGDEPLMLPPTVSTYNQRPAYVPPPPDLTTLRRELTEALEDALKVLKESDKCPDDSQGWYELQGLHLLDITTLAIRAAKTYYTAHTRPQALYAIKSEREIRKELYEVLEILKKMAARNFEGGLRKAEKVGILQWIVGISEVIQCEIEHEKKEQEKREKFAWRTGDWNGREREREFQFLKCFIDAPDDLPEWTDPNSLDEQLPTRFLQHFQNGLKLVLLHNELVQTSKKHFEEIKTWHTDTAKPYRCAENLRFWIKAAQLRWEINLDVDVMDIVQGTKPEAWKKFDESLMKWCKGVREELTAEWEQQKTPARKPPSLRIDTVAKDEQSGKMKQIGNDVDQLKM